jgi:AcrR family transcriptional regulator
MDPRIARTRSSLQEALLGLAREHPLDDISVADIAERAGVNRSSFYQHYSDKDTLLADAIDAVAEEAGANIPEFREITPDVPPILLGYLRHVEENAALYARVFTSPIAVARLRRRIQGIASVAVATAPALDHDDIPSDIRAAGLTGSVLAVLEEWLAHDPRPPAETAALWLWKVLLGPMGFDGSNGPIGRSTPGDARAATS